MADFEEEVRRHNEKWKRWISDLKNQDYGSKTKPQKKQEEPVKGDSAYRYAVNLIEKLNDGQQMGKGEKAIQKQFENNVCYVCAQIMIPPKKPIILFPCSHNICQICIYKDGSERKRKYTLKEQKCPKCRKNIENHAVNWNLTTLLCSFTNNKDLLDEQLKMKNKEQNEFENEKDMDSKELQKLRIRCEILRNQKYNLDRQITKDSKSLSILEAALDQLEKEQKRNQEEMQKFREEKKLIKKFLAEKEKELGKIEIYVEEAEKKQKVVMKTLEPLRKQMEKMKILEAAQNI